MGRLYVFVLILCLAFKLPVKKWRWYEALCWNAVPESPKSPLALEGDAALFWKQSAVPERRTRIPEKPACFGRRRCPVLEAKRRAGTPGWNRRKARPLWKAPQSCSGSEARSARASFVSKAPRSNTDNPGDSRVCPQGSVDGSNTLTQTTGDDKTGNSHVCNHRKHPPRRAR